MVFVKPLWQELRAALKELPRPWGPVLDRTLVVVVWAMVVGPAAVVALWSLNQLAPWFPLRVALSISNVVIFVEALLALALGVVAWTLIRRLNKQSRSSALSCRRTAGGSTIGGRRQTNSSVTPASFSPGPQSSVSA